MHLLKNGYLFLLNLSAIKLPRKIILTCMVELFFNDCFELDYNQILLQSFSNFVVCLLYLISY